MTKEMQKLCDKRAELQNKGQTLVADNKFDELAKVNSELKEIDNQITALEQFEASAKESVTAEPVPNETKKFKNLAEQLKAIMDAGRSGGKKVDPRLLKNDLSGGLNTTIDADGGYAIQTDFIGPILDKAFERSEIMNRCATRSITADSNRASWVTLDDAGDASQSGVVVAGGVQAYWCDEGTTVLKSKPQYKNHELKLAKVMGICYTTEEMLQDVPFTSQVVEDAFSDAVSGLITEGILNGHGARSGYPLEPVGIMGSNALVTVAPTSTSLTAQDLLNLKARMTKKAWANAVFVMHPDLEASLPLLNVANNMVYLPEGGLSGSQYATILGRPVIFDEFMAAKGTKGDILLADFGQYLLIKKGEERKDWSIHVAFLTDEQVFRIILRVNGMPFRNEKFAVRNSSVTRSPFVTLGARGTKLTAPTVSINASTGVPSWSSVSNASGYTYSIKAAGETSYGEEQDTTSTSLSALTDGDTIVVKAKGNGTTYVDSDWSEPKTYTAG